jgi:Ser/Thr protein kinase RdoA (MazF antagonist)
VTSLAQAVARIHSVDANLTRGFSPHPINLSYTWKLLSQSATQIDGWLAARRADEIQVAFAHLAGHALTLVNRAAPLWKTAPSAPVHGDLKLENMLHSRGRVVLLDWEQFGLGDPALDAATFLHVNRQELDQAMQAHWLEIYLAAVDQPGLSERIDVYDKLLPFQAVCFLLDGLRETLLGDDLNNELGEAGPEAIEATRQFLTETIVASWRHAARKLDCRAVVGEEEVRVLFERG